VLTTFVTVLTPLLPHVTHRRSPDLIRTYLRNLLSTANVIKTPKF
jgi:hypothetical protein